jgi:hypothetical protein
MPVALSSVLDIAIVLAGLYIGLSSICSWCNEQIAVVLELRGKKLYLGVANLLFSRTLANQIFGHPLIDASVNDKGGIERDPSAPNRPAYVDPRNFAIAFWDELSNATAGIVSPATRAATSQAEALKMPAASPNGAQLLAVAAELSAVRGMNAGATGALSSSAHFEDLRQVVNGLQPGKLKTNALALIADAKDYDSLLTATETWFNRQMDRVSGWYKRQAQYILVILAVVVTFASGLDTLEIAQRLYTSPVLLSAASNQISTAYKPPNAGSPAPSNSDQTALGKIALSIFKGDDFRQFFHPGFGIFTAVLSEDERARNQIALETAQNEYAAAKAHSTDDDAVVSKNYKELLAALNTQKNVNDALAAAQKSGKSTPAELQAANAASASTEAAVGKQQAADAKATADLAAERAAADSLAQIQWSSGFDRSHILGCLMTILAISLGAPFWFDLLGKLVSVRATGAKPDQKTT